MACAHDLCRCEETTVERSGKKFCSEHCADAVDRGHDVNDEEACTCGHVDCMSTEAIVTAPP